MDEVNEDFGAGYSDDAEQTTTPAMQPVEEAKPVEEVPAVEYAQIPKSDYEKLMAKIAEIDTIKAEQTNKFNTLFGNYGGLRQTLDSFKNEATGEIEISDEDFKELKADYPEVADQSIAGLKRILSKLKVPNQQNSDLAEKIYQERFAPELQRISQDFEQKFKQKTEFLQNDIIMRAHHQDWYDVLRDKEYQTFVEKEKLDPDPVSHDVLADQITRFKSAKKPPEAAAKDDARANQNAIRQKRLEAAINPKGSGGSASSSKSELDEFKAGYDD